MRNILLSFLLIFIISCAPSRFVKPLQKNEQTLSLSFGGPLINFNKIPMPIPLSTLCYAYGITNQTTSFGSIHTTSLLFGNFQTDLGIVQSLRKNDSIWGISISPAFQIIYNFRNKTGFKIWPSLEANVYYKLPNSTNYLYLGNSNWMEFSKYKAHGEKQNTLVLPDIHLGWLTNSKKWNHQIEIKYIAPGINNLPNVVPYIGINHKGTLGIYYNITFKF
ncbi:MAG: hypothetical protein KatS3mg027_1761 [Bacteroidia bacterium]|nr:MAG: hypothetical protein KatS3mg027_1761 [Bacteroidia bacterium]